MSSNRKTVVCRDKEGVSSALSALMEERLRKFRADTENGAGAKKFLVGLSGGSMAKLFARAAQLRPSGSDWSCCCFFFVDERLVSFTDNNSSFKAYRDNLLGADGRFGWTAGDISEDQFMPIKPELSADACAVDYEQRLRAAASHFSSFHAPPPRFDLLLLGMGPDGHTCSLFPGHELLFDRTRVVAPITDSPKPPPSRVTLTLPAINAAAAVAFVVTGAEKADVVAQIFAGGRGAAVYPSALVRPEDGQLVWILDEPAAEKMNK